MRKLIDTLTTIVVALMLMLFGAMAGYIFIKLPAEYRSQPIHTEGQEL